MTIIRNMRCENIQSVAECLKYIKENPVITMPTGKYEVGDRGMYVILQKYETKNPKDCDWESHKKYIDFQFILSGGEKTLVSDLSNMKQGKYNEETDCMISFGNAMKEITLIKGMGIVFMPSDVHKPCLHMGLEPTCVRKAVFKIPINCF